MRLPPGFVWLEGFAGTWAVSHAVSMVVFVLTVALFTRVLRQERPPTSAISWLLAIGLIPYLGVPLFLLLDGRKRRAALDKPPLHEAQKLAPGFAEASGSQASVSVAALMVEQVLSAARIPTASIGNSCVLLPTGCAARRAIFDAIDQARACVRITTFIIGDDDVGEALLERLAAAARRGVEVRLLIDGFFTWRMPRAAVAHARDAGVRIGVFMPVLSVPFRGRANLRNHRKIVIVDGDVGFVGGMNFAREYMGQPAHARTEPAPRTPHWRDLMLQVQGPAVARLDEIFRSDWAFAGREALVAAEQTARLVAVDQLRVGRSRVQVVPSGPDVPGDTLYDAVLTALFRAERRVWIATPYFVPDEALLRGLVLAVRRGVEVVVVVPARSNHLSADLAGASALRELQRAGAQVRPWGGGMLHAKAALFDDVAMLGSANFDVRSLFLSYEVTLLLTSARDVAVVEAWFRDTLAACAPRLVDPGRARAAFEAVGRLLAPLA